MASKRFLMVPEDSSAARMPRPGATMASAIRLSSVRFIGGFLQFVPVDAILPAFGARARGASSRSQGLDTGQRLAFEPLEKSPARGRHIGEPIGHAGGIERRDGVAAAGNRNKLPAGSKLRRGLGNLDRAVVERFQLEGAEWPVPYQSFCPRKHGNDVLHGARTDIEDHVVGADPSD